MRTTLAIQAFAAIAAAMPAAHPQDIDFDMVIAVPNPSYTTVVGATAQAVTYDITSIVAQATAAVSSVSDNTSDVTDTTAVVKRSIERRSATACAPQPSGATGAPTVTTDTPAAFTANAAFSSLAVNAATPSGYTNQFTNLNGSNNAYGYLGYTTLQNYDTALCASKCNAINGCMSFNLYFERDPSVDPGTGTTSCQNPASVTMIKCVFWGGPVSTSNANNYGQWRNQFQVVIAGSNGYTNNTLVVPPGYSSPGYLGNAAINAPYDSQGYDTYMGSTIFNSGPFNASLCAAHCDAQTAYNLAHPASDGSPPKVCNFFNTYILYVNTTANLQGQYCAMYTEAWSSTYATNVGQYRGSDHYLIEYSYTFTKSPNSAFAPKVGDKNGAVHQASADISYSSLQPFCSAYLGYRQAVATVTASTTVTPLATSTATALTTVTASAANNGKRDLSTPTVLAKYPPTVLSSACSLQVSPATGTSTTTAATATATAATSTVATTTTSTITASPIPTTCGNQGIQYAYYANEPWGDYIYYMTPESYWGVKPDFASSTTEVGGIAVSDPQSVPLYDSNHYVPSTYFVLNHRGYIFAQVAGTYTFSTSNADDMVFLYLGANAYKGYTRNNADAMAVCCSYPGNQASKTYTLAAGEYLPFRIVFGQQGGPVVFSFTITAPDGTVILDHNTKNSDFIVQQSCDGTSAPPFLAWGSE